MTTASGHRRRTSACRRSLRLEYRTPPSARCLSVRFCTGRPRHSRSPLLGVSPSPQDPFQSSSQTLPERYFPTSSFTPFSQGPCSSSFTFPGLHLCTRHTSPSSGHTDVGRVTRSPVLPSTPVTLVLTHPPLVHHGGHPCHSGRLDPVSGDLLGPSFPRVNFVVCKWGLRAK